MFRMWPARTNLCQYDHRYDHFSFLIFRVGCTKIMNFARILYVMPKRTLTVFEMINWRERNEISNLDPKLRSYWSITYSNNFAKVIFQMRKKVPKYLTVCFLSISKKYRNFLSPRPLPLHERISNAINVEWFNIWNVSVFSNFREVFQYRLTKKS